MSHTVLFSPIMPNIPERPPQYCPIQSRFVSSHCCHFCCQKVKIASISDDRFRRRHGFVHTIHCVAFCSTPQPSSIASVASPRATHALQTSVGHFSPWLLPHLLADAPILTVLLSPSLNLSKRRLKVLRLFSL